MKQIYYFTLNYDSIVELILDKLGYMYLSTQAHDISYKAKISDVIGYNYNTCRFIPTFYVSKLHGDFEHAIAPGKLKYTETLNEGYFELIFNMKI